MTKLINSLLFSILILHLSVCASEDELSNGIAQAWKHYNNGNINKAIEKFDNLYKGIKKTPEQKNIHKRFLLLATKLDICNENYLFDCGFNGSEELKKILGEVKNKDLKERFSWIYYYYALASLVYESYEQEDVDKIKVGHGFSAMGTEYYVRLNLLLSNFYIDLDRNRAREYLDIALGAMLANKNLNDFEFAKYLNEAFILLTRLDNPVKADQLHSIAGNYMAKQLSGSLPLLLRYRYCEASHLYNIQDFSVAIRALKQAEVILDEIKAPEITKIVLGNDIYSMLAISCYFISDLDCASAALDKHPYNTFLENNKAKEYKDDYTFSVFLAIKLGVDLRRGAEITNDFLALFKDVDSDKKKEGKDVTKNPIETAYPYKLYALALKKHVDNHGGGDELAIKAGKMLVEQHRQILISTDNSFPIPHAVDRLILQDVLYAIYRRNNVHEYSDLILKIFYALNRGLFDVDTMAIESLAKSGSQENKRLIHSKIRMADKFGALQLTSLENEISLRSSNTMKRAERKFDFNLYWKLSKFSEKLKGMNTAIKSLVNKQVYGDFPSIKKLQDSLNKNEAYLTYSAVHTNRLSLFCTTKENVYFKVLKIDSNSLTQDIKLINYALTATHQPNPKLDSQYPVKSAVNLYRAFIHPISECLRNKTNIIWSPEDRLRSFPISALLVNTPEKTNDGWKLDEAEWLGLAYGITYAGSANRFIYSRSLRKHTKRDNRFFGIGNPIIKTLDIKPSKEIDVSNVNKNVETLRHIINSFEELPETGNELKEISKIAGKDSKIFIRDSATEQNLRRELLDEYSVISFATHGILKDEVSGISQESLILTPVVTDIASRDGILTSAEIADLNLSADLVVLSACNTANVELNSTTKGITGLSTAFSIAGSPTIMASLWSVHSLSTRQLMTLFHKNYFNDKNKNIALSLRDAIKSFFIKHGKQYSHPRYWSAFVIFGDGGSTGDSEKDGTRNIKMLSKHIDKGGLIGGSAYLGALSNNGKFVYIAGTKNFKTNIKKYDSFVYMFDPRGNKKIWERKNVVSGIVPHSMLAYNDGLIIASHREVDKTFIPHLLRIDDKGNLLWQKDIEADNHDTPMQTTLSKDDEGNLTLVTGSHKGNFPAKLKAYKINPDGSFKQSKTLNMGLTDNEVFRRIRHITKDENIFIAVSYSHYYKNNEVGYNDYGLLEICRPEDNTKIITITKNNLALQSVYSMDSISIFKLRVDKDEGIIAAGTKQAGCNSISSAIAIRITSDNHEVIYEKNEFPGWVGTDISITRNNHYILSGIGERAFSYDRIEHDGIDGKNDKYLSEELTNQREKVSLAVNEPFIDIFDSKGTVKSKKILQFGTSVDTEGAIIVGNDLLLHGDMGNDPVLINITY